MLNLHRARTRRYKGRNYTPYNAQARALKRKDFEELEKYVFEKFEKKLLLT